MRRTNYFRSIKCEAKSFKKRLVCRLFLVDDRRYVESSICIYSSISFSLSFTHEHTHTHTHSLTLSLIYILPNRASKKKNQLLQYRKKKKKDLTYYARTMKKNEVTSIVFSKLYVYLFDRLRCLLSHFSFFFFIPIQIFCF